MCGISAILKRTGVQDADISSLQRMLRVQQHRGPDASQVKKLDNAALGHVRLSIIDIDGGTQPMSAHDGRYTIVFNGEIFNYLELRKRLEKSGCRFKSKSDTEVLLHAYITWGTAVVSHLNGQFAFVIWDSVNNSAFAARDRFGEKPFYYSQIDDSGLIISSEIKGLLASKYIKPKIDRSSLDLYLSLLYIPPDRSIYANINSLPPACCMTWSHGALKSWRYWEPEFSTKHKTSRDQIIEGTQFYLKQSVSRQMQSDVPIGALLSGGLDSSTTVALMSKLSEKPIKTFCAYFGDTIDERPYANAVSTLYKTEHHELNVDFHIEEHIHDLLNIYDEPFADSSAIATYLISKYASEYVKVVLTGDGADEVFGGYGWYTKALMSQELHEGSFSLVGNRLLKAIYSTVGISDKRNNMAEKIRLHKSLQRHGSILNQHIKEQTSYSKLKSNLGYKPSIDSIETMRKSFMPNVNYSQIDQIFSYDYKTYLPGDILRKVDRASMAVSLESRAPFLDVDLVEFVISNHWGVRLEINKSKSLLRDAFSDSWPSNVRNREKQGFGGPVEQWIKRPAMQSMTKNIFNKSHIIAEFFPNIERAIENCTSQDWWTLLMLGLWLEKHGDTLS
ncbi:MAG: asparagine synthase (glutamine-hydrolyzing) [Gammaproteobacteria bacterium]|nr:asparagine synthase (glutamine-hydrolyzing) [Gammaproteobacteria bacterium]